MSQCIFHSSLHTLNFLTQGLVYISKQEIFVDLNRYSVFKECLLIFTLLACLFLNVTVHEDHMSLCPHFPKHLLLFVWIVLSLAANLGYF